MELYHATLIKKETKNKETTENQYETKISKKKLQGLIKDAEKRMSNNKVQPVKEIKYDPDYYKKIHYDNKKEFVEGIMDEDLQKKYPPQNVLVLQIYYKDAEEIDFMIYVKANGKWKFLYRFK